MSIGARLAELRARIAAACAAAGRDAAEVVLVAVSKNHPAAAVREAMAHGQTVFGENRVQELAGKARELAEAGPEWHMVGTVQTNKVKDLLAVPGLALIHSLDREKLADALQARWASARQGRGPLRCLLQVAVTGEPTKHGVPVDGARALLTHVVRDCPDLAPCGLMAMGPLDG
ncbi:MAG TPA: YggS family pyridoxal phosphate-dependent enzyme, partial [Planctomycetota bacterium]|nr:YggS family pyridoxal phosphate-dependent enzyme [Planctomycetota bacterium]